MKADIAVPTLDIYKPIHDIKSGVIIMMSGRGTGKTWFMSRYANKKTLEDGERVCILRDEKTKVKESIQRDIKDAYDRINDGMEGELDKYYSFTDQGLSIKDGGDTLLFSLGFRASSKDDKTKMKGLSGVKLVIIDEAEDVRDESKVNTLMDTVIRENALVVFILNTPDKDHWLIKRYFTLEPSEHEGYFIPIPKDIDNVHYFLPTYKDNPKLAPAAVARYKSYGEPESENYDLDHYLSSILGLVSEGRKGRIFKDWKRISEKDFGALPYASKYGLDFGFTNHPSALVEIKEHNNRLYLRQRIYAHGLTNPVIAKRIKSMNIEGTVGADEAEPKSIEEIKQHGVRIEGIKKGPGSINAGIDKMQAYREVFVCEDSEDLWNEYLNYVWALNKNKVPTNNPVDDFNHGMDAIRYGLDVTSKTVTLSFA